MWARVGPEQYGSFDRVALDPISLLHKGAEIAMDGVRDFMTEGSGQLLGVLHEIRAEEFTSVDIATGRRKGVWLGFMNQIELEGMRVARLRHPRK